ncbi:unnamed protein product [Larinioides sclopetarius]|uniref:PH domain-containing protein n=1 Tax=Larinioides sclopetarius TaxID=280406 RepID=A0AAV1ZA02_9ARAC
MSLFVNTEVLHQSPCTWLNLTFLDKKQGSIHSPFHIQRARETQADWITTLNRCLHSQTPAGPDHFRVSHRQLFKNHSQPEDNHLGGVEDAP